MRLEARCRLRAAAGSALVPAALLLTACGSGAGADPTPDEPDVVVTYSVLGAVVHDLVGDAARVRVLMPDGIDPHDWEPSAKDVEAVHGAEIVVANGLGLEESLEGVLDEAAAEGVRVFLAGDHIDVRAIGDGAPDPHLWMDPLAMRDVVRALGPALADAGIPVGGRVAEVEAELAAVHAEVAAVVAPVPEDRRSLVTGHESLGYFSDRYGFTLAGAVVPSTSSQAEASAGAMAEVKERILDLGLDVIFTETGTSGDLVEAIASETDVTVVRLSTHDLPDDGTYRTFILDLAAGIANALTAAVAH